jgi:hypothetical protein
LYNVKEVLFFLHDIETDMDGAVITGRLRGRKWEGIIKVAPNENWFGFPHFVHVMEYFYLLTEIIIQNPSRLVIVIQPSQKYKSRYVNSYFSHLVQKWGNFVFVDPGAEKKLAAYGYHPSKQYEFNHDGLKECGSFLLGGRTVSGELLTWFQHKSSADIIRNSFVTQQPTDCTKPLRIGLVNRKNSSGRAIENMTEVCERIRDELGEIVETVYFEDKSFQEQILFFNAHNVIISPHGAQLCSIPFAPKNSIIIECCHTEWHPYYYFPGLSIRSSKTHVMICDNHSVFPAWRPSYIKKHLNILV